MENKRNLIILLLVFALVLGGAGILYRQLGRDLAPDQLATQEPPRETERDSGSQPENQTEAPLETPKAPDFTVYDAEGNAVRLSDFAGKPVVLNFWASWCVPCRMEMPDFQEKYLELGEDVQFLMVNMTDGARETQETASGFVAENGFTFPVLYDTQYQAASAYGVYSLPTTYFLDAEGYAVAQASGAIDAETLQKGIDMIR